MSAITTTTATTAAESRPTAESWWRDPSHVQAVRHYAQMSGLLYRSKPLDGNAAVNISVTLQPAKFPKELFDLVWSIQPDLNEVLDAVSRDLQFLEEALRSVMKADDFTRRLFQLLVDSQAVSKQPKAVVGIHRTDYLLDMGECPDTALGIKQVEVNTISASMGGLYAIRDFHQYVHSRYFDESKLLNIPEPTFLAEALATAWKQYRQPDAYVLFVSEEEVTNLNIYDQRKVEFDLWTKYHIKSFRRTFKKLSSEAKLGDDLKLFVSNLEVAVVYYRTAYSPEDYASDEDWATRLLLESSCAASCPPVAYQLVGTKKMQQVLALPGVLERFVDDPDKIRLLRSTFTALHSLDMGSEGDKAIERALEAPTDFILKPQREGGNNNLHGQKMKTVLKTLKSSREREGYILMNKIHPPAHQGLILRPVAQAVELHDIFVELGIFGLYVRHGDKVLLNKSGGCLGRSKPTTSNEGGINVQIGALDSIHLVPTTEFMRTISKEE